MEIIFNLFSLVMFKLTFFIKSVLLLWAAISLFVLGMIIMFLTGGDGVALVVPLWGFALLGGIIGLGGTVLGGVNHLLEQSIAHQDRRNAEQARRDAPRLAAQARRTAIITIRAELRRVITALCIQHDQWEKTQWEKTQQDAFTLGIPGIKR